jgi:hypothetical protein
MSNQKLVRKYLEGRKEHLQKVWNTITHIDRFDAEDISRQDIDEMISIQHEVDDVNGYSYVFKYLEDKLYPDLAYEILEYLFIYNCIVCDTSHFYIDLCDKTKVKHIEYISVRMDVQIYSSKGMKYNKAIRCFFLNLLKYKLDNALHELNDIMDDEDTYKFITIHGFDALLDDFIRLPNHVKYYSDVRKSVLTLQNKKNFVSKSFLIDFIRYFNNSLINLDCSVEIFANDYPKVYRCARHYFDDVKTKFFNLLLDSLGDKITNVDIERFMKIY